MSLEPDAIEIIRFSLDDDSGISLRDSRSWLSENESARAGRFRFPHLRDRYVRGRGMLRWQLGRHLGRSPDELVFDTGPHGKPELIDRSIHFNLSHSEDRAALAISRLPSIGIDIERFDRKIDCEGLARRCFRDGEWRRHSGLPTPERTRGFFWLWTAKEARMKATGEGFQLSPQKIEIEFEGDRPVGFLEPEEPQAFLGTVDFPGGDAACSVAALAPFHLVEALERPGAG